MTRKGHPGTVAVALAALATALALAVLLATPPADAARRYKVVTKTFSSTQQITMATYGAAIPYPSETNADGFRRGKVLDLDLTLKNFDHSWPRDVDMMLSHGATNRTVMSDVGAGTTGNITLALDDEAAGPLPLESRLAGGRFKPTNYGGSDLFPAPAPVPSGLSELSGFDGKNPNGPWQLWVTDDISGDGGQFAGGWSITIKARVLRR